MRQISRSGLVGKLTTSRSASRRSGQHKKSGSPHIDSNRDAVLGIEIQKVGFRPRDSALRESPRERALPPSIRLRRVTFARLVSIRRDSSARETG